MLRAYRGNNSRIRMNYFANLFNITYVFSAHFTYKNLGLRFHIFANCPNNAHRGIKATRCKTNVIFFFKNSSNNMLCACFSVATRNSYYFHILKRTQFFLCVINVPLFNRSFRRSVDNINGNSGNSRKIKQHQNRNKKRNSNVFKNNCTCAKRRQNNKRSSVHSFHT